MAGNHQDRAARLIPLVNLLRRTGLSLDDLSSTADISRQRLAELSEGAEPSLSEVRRIAEGLGMSISELTVADHDQDKTELLFRNTLRQRPEQYESAVTTFSRRIASSLKLLGGTEEVPSWISFGIEKMTYEEAELRAEAFRDRFAGGNQVGPLLNLPKIALEEMRVLLFVVPKQKVDGATALVEGRPFIFVSPRFPARMLFTLAHEIGHLTMSPYASPEYANVDGENQTGKIRRSSRKEEAFVDAFASCLLLPRAGVGITLKKLREMAEIQSAEIGDIEVLYLARIFGVSFQVAARRCEDLALLPEGGAVSLYETLRKKHGSPEKRAEEVGVPPRPSVEFPSVPRELLETSIKRISSGDLSVGRAASYIGCSISDIFDAHAKAIQ
jgi:Zn-dependent peptidase ImmA (M78 family)